MANPNIIIIGLCGRARSGKSTAAQFLRETYGAHCLAFAKPLKDAMHIIFPDIPRETFDTSAKDKPSPETSSMCGYTPREMMQFIGTELFRETLAARFPRIGGKIWARAVGAQIEQIRQISREPTIIIVEDIRYPNEAQEVIDHGGQIWYINSSREIAIAASAVQHSSEQFSAQTLLASRIIDNNGSLEQFREKLRTVLQLSRKIE